MGSRITRVLPSTQAARTTKVDKQLAATMVVIIAKFFLYLTWFTEGWITGRGAASSNIKHLAAAIAITITFSSNFLRQPAILLLVVGAFICSLLGGLLSLQLMAICTLVLSLLALGVMERMSSFSSRISQTLFCLALQYLGNMCYISLLGDIYPEEPPRSFRIVSVVLSALCSLLIIRLKKLDPAHIQMRSIPSVRALSWIAAWLCVQSCLVKLLPEGYGIVQVFIRISCYFSKQACSLGLASWIVVLLPTVGFFLHFGEFTIGNLTLLLLLTTSVVLFSRRDIQISSGMLIVISFYVLEALCATGFQNNELLVTVCACVFAAATEIYQKWKQGEIKKKDDSAERLQIG